MSNKPLRYNPEEVMVIVVDMHQDQFDYTIEVAKEALNTIGKINDTDMAKFMTNKLNEKFGPTWMSIIGDS